MHLCPPKKKKKEEKKKEFENTQENEPINQKLFEECCGLINVSWNPIEQAMRSSFYPAENVVTTAEDKWDEEEEEEGHYWEDFFVFVNIFKYHLHFLSITV